MERRFAAQVKLVPGERGAFAVRVNGRLVFSKADAGRFPDNVEIFAHFR